MSSYPYPAFQHFPDDEGHRQYRRSFNIRSAFATFNALRPEE
jgi:hypothetical protein